jgi:PIN domain nuclease of toxin-antitoxin system
MDDVVFDSSILLAILKSERLNEPALNLIDRAVISSVNVAEVYTKLSELKMLSTQRVDALVDACRRVEPFSLNQARLAGLLREKTLHAGLSLGDRACLALGLELGAAIYTTDGDWLKVDVGANVLRLR